MAMAESHLSVPGNESEENKKDEKSTNKDSTSFTVAVRIRPLTDDELHTGQTKIAHQVENKFVVLMDPTEDPDDVLRANRSRERQYVFDWVFDSNAYQRQVYEQTTKALINSVINGFNATVFAYGATGAGKTYTMLGSDHDPGIMVRSINDLFEAMEKSSDEYKYSVDMSYLEIYNEMIRDLLAPESGYLDLREDSKGGCHVAGLSSVSTKSTKEVMRLLMIGNKQRTQEPTATNPTSSRSHAVLQVTVQQFNRIRLPSEDVNVGKLFLIDLAGSERGSQSKNRGKRMVEGAHINRSLLALGNCINALSDRHSRHSYINYRDSKLTRLLKDSLGGNCKTVMIANISSSTNCFEESRNTLLYADRARNIKTKVRRNLTNVSYHIAQYTSIISDLRNEIVKLKSKLHEHDVRRMHSPARLIQTVQKEMQSSFLHEEFSQLKDQLVLCFTDQTDLRRSLADLDATNMDISMDISRHLLTIADWEQEKTKKAIREKALRRNSIHDNKLDSLFKQQELEGIGSDNLEEPGDVLLARVEINNLLSEQKRLIRYKLELEKKLESAENRAHRVLDVINNKASSIDHQEITKLLIKCHELEVENIEMYQASLLREHMLRQKDMTIARYESHKNICDEIILLQKVMLDDKTAVPSVELEELYELYNQGSEDLTIGDIPKTSLLRTEGDLDRLPDISQVKSGQTGGADSSMSDKLFTKSSFSTANIRPSFLVAKQPSITSLTTSMDNSRPPSGSQHHLEDSIGPMSNERREIMTNTKSISAIAARKRNDRVQDIIDKYDLSDVNNATKGTTRLAAIRDNQMGEKSPSEESMTFRRGGLKRPGYQQRQKLHVRIFDPTEMPWQQPKIAIRANKRENKSNPNLLISEEPSLDDFSELYSTADRGRTGHLRFYRSNHESGAPKRLTAGPVVPRNSLAVTGFTLPRDHLKLPHRKL